MKTNKILILVVILLLVAAGSYAVFHMVSFSANRSAMSQDTDNGISENTALSNGESLEQPLTQEPLEEIAEHEQQLPEPEPQPPELRFMAMGDIMLGRGVGARLRKAGGYEKAFEKVAFYLNFGDIVFANLETPLTDSTHGLDKDRKIVLKAEPESVSALTYAGINLISLSNNHILDYYEKGLFDTMEILDKNGIKHAGAGRNIEEARTPAIIEKKWDEDRSFSLYKLC